LRLVEKIPAGFSIKQILAPLLLTSPQKVKSHALSFILLLQGFSLRKPQYDPPDQPLSSYTGWLGREERYNMKF
jgi:hypothetical protein